MKEFDDLEFMFGIMDKVDTLEPQTVEDLEKIAEMMHEAIEKAMEGYAEDDPNMDASEYTRSY